MLPSTIFATAVPGYDCCCDFRARGGYFVFVALLGRFENSTGPQTESSLSAGLHWDQERDLELTGR